MATLFAWTGALKKRGELDGIPELSDFADRLEKAALGTLDEGIMTKDLSAIAETQNRQSVGTEEFLRAVGARL